MDEKKGNRNKSIEQTKKIKEFDDVNLLSYVYEKKEHKAYEYRAINEKRINVIGKTFNSTTGMLAKETNIIEQEAKARDQVFD